MRTDNNIRRIKFLFVMIGLLLCLQISASAAGVTFQNKDTGYSAIIIDDADILKGSKTPLKAPMEAITAYGNAMLATAESHSGSTLDCAREYYREYFGKESGTLFLIDMQEREIYIFSDGEIYRTVRKQDTLIITDNVYQLAADGNYIDCAAEAFEQILVKLEGGKLSSGMRYFSSALMAVMMALMITFGIAKATAVTGLVSEKELLEHVLRKQSLKNSRRLLLDREYRDVSSDSDGGGSSGGGGGSSGGGGGHGF